MKRFAGIVLGILLLAVLFVQVYADSPLPVISIASIRTKTDEGAQIEVDIKLENNPGMVSMTVPIVWDSNVFSLVEVKNTDGILPSWSGMPDLSSVTDTYYISWSNDAYPDGNFGENGLLCTLVLRQKKAMPEGSVSDIHIDTEDPLLSLMNFDMQDYSRGEVPGMIFSYVDGAVTFTQQEYHTLRGTVTSYGSETDAVTIQLIRKGSLLPDQEITVQGKKAAYSFDQVSPGDYVIRVSKKNHVTREYAVTVGD